MVEQAQAVNFEKGLLLKVAIVDDFRGGQPFALKTRHGMALVFAFWGDTDEVGEFMQKAGHATRSYFVNANGLKGFLVPTVIAILKEANRSGELK